MERVRQEKVNRENNERDKFLWQKEILEAQAKAEHDKLEALKQQYCRGVTSLLWNNIELSWKLHLPEHLFRIFTYKYGIVVTF